MSTVEQIRDVQRTTWAACADGWDKWDDIIRRQLGPDGDAIIDALEFHPRQEHLDIASGIGEPGLSLARHVPQGRVVLTDLAPEMLEVAARRACEQGLTNIETAVCSADHLPSRTRFLTASQCGSGTCSFPTWRRSRPSSCVC